MSVHVLPGWLLLVAVALASQYLSELIVVGGKHPLEASALAVVFGILIRNAVGLFKVLQPGVATAEKLLILGIVLMGAGFDYNVVQQQGWQILTIILGTMAVAFVLILGLGRMFQLPSGLSLLLSVGTTICGTSAIAITAPLIKAKEEETSYAVGTVALWGLVAILLYPKVGQMLGLSDLTFGVFAGTAIHSTPQVVGAGYIYSEAAGNTATAIKLVRNCFMAPLAILIALWFARQTSKVGTGAVKVDWKRAFPWFLFGYFLRAFFNTRGYFTKAGIAAFSETGKFFILLGMVGVGLSTQLSAFKSVGFKPLLVGLIGAIVLAAISAAMIFILL